MTVPDGKGGKSAYLRLGAYVSDESGFPSTYKGTASETNGIFMSTQGTLTLVSGTKLYAETDESVAIVVDKGDFSMTADSTLSLTAKSLFVQSGHVVDQSASVPSLPVGQAKFDTAFQFEARSNSGNVVVDCPASGYKKTTSTGFEEVWGNQEKSNGTAASIVLGALTDVPIGVYPSFSWWRMKVRLTESKMALSASTMALYKIGAHVTKLDNKSIWDTLLGIGTFGIGLHVKNEITSLNQELSKALTEAFTITQEEIDADLWGAHNGIAGAYMRSY